MVNISKKRVAVKIEHKINNRLLEIFLELNKSKKFRNFFDDFFTDTEKIMLAKRISIIFMLINDVPFVTIQNTLKVSSSTIKIYAEKIDGGFYNEIVKVLHNKNNKEIFWSELGNIVTANLPKQGKGRWKWLDRHIEMEKKLKKLRHD